MAILRQFRDEEVRRVYRQAAVVYLVAALLVLGLTSLLPPLAAAAAAAGPTWQSVAATVFFIFVAFAVVFRGHRTLTILLSLLCLLQALGHLARAAGLRFSFRPETALPANVADVAAWQAFLTAELATQSPFYDVAEVASQTPFALLGALRSAPIAGGAVPAGGPTVQPALILYVCAAFLLVATLFLWRAVRKRPS